MKTPVQFKGYSMKTPEQKAKHAAYMREYYKRNYDSINAAVKRRHLENPIKKQMADKLYYDKTAESRQSPEAKALAVVNSGLWAKANRKKINAIRRAYIKTEHGKLQKHKADVAYVLSGKRKEIENKRAAQPLSEPRKQSRLRYQLKRRSGEALLGELSSLVLTEAVKLCSMRKSATGINWHVDHIVPVSKGGSAEFDNLQVVPAYWNQSKSNRHSNTYFPRGISRA